jgi:hypothetical protein
MPDSVGNSFDSAQGISLSPTFKTFSESIDPGDTDFYRFTLNQRSSFTLALTNLAANVDVKLFDGTGTSVVVGGVTQNSTNTGTLVDSLNTVLDPGTYYIQVLGGSATTTSPYNLNVLADNNLRTDLAWHRTSGENVLWQLAGLNIANLPFLPLSEPGDISAGAQIEATGDLTGDGFTDLIWRNRLTGANYIWSLDGAGNFLSRIDLPGITDNLNWRIGGTGDFNGDGNIDIVLRDPTTDTSIIWIMNRTALAGIEFLPSTGSSNWQIQATGDFDLDGRSDIVLRNQATGDNIVWFMNGTTLSGLEFLPKVEDTNWRIFGTGDFNRDGQTDIFWRNVASGDNIVWNLNRVSFDGQINFLPAVRDLEWTPIAPVTRVLPAVVRDLAGVQAAPFSIGALNGNGIYRDTIGGPGDDEDVYQFTVGSPTQLNLTVSGPNASPLVGAVNMRLFNSSNTVVQDATTTGGNSTLSRLIPAGTYFIRLAPGAAGASITYDLRLDANNLPVLATNRALVVSEGLAQAITSTLLRVTDENNTAEQITFSVVSLPGRGSLLIDGSSITTGSIFTQADINNGRLSYGQNGSETLTDTFSFGVSDGVGGTIPTTSFIIQVVPTNDPPVLLSNNQVSLSEGATASLTSTNLFVTDTEQIASQIRYTLSSLPTSGGLSLGGVPLTAGGTFTQADLATPGRVTYRNNGGEASTDTFVFSASDGAGGIITPATGTFTFAISNINDIPVLVTNAGLSVTEAGVKRIDSTLLRVTDAEQLTEALQDQLVYTIQSGPTRGTLTRNGTATTTFSQADINNGRILYTETARGVNSDRFTFTVVDNAGAAISPATQTFNIAVTGANFVPVLTTNLGLTLTEGTSSVITPARLLVSDIDNAPSELIYQVTQLPTNGSLNLLGTPLTAIGQTFTQADLNAPTSLVSYRQNGSETTTDSFVFTVVDGSGNVVPGSNTFSISVIPSNDAPQLLTNTRLTLSEGAIASITAGSILQATDVDNLDSQITYNVIAGGPLNGTLLRSGTTATSFTQADLASEGLVQYQHNGSESTADSFLFEVVDQGGASAGTFTFNVAVTPVNDSPGLSLNTGLTLDEGASSTITPAELLLTDGDGPLPLVYTLTTAPTNGVLKLGALTLGTTGNTTFTQADIAANRLVYTHNGSETTEDTFSFSASDSATGATIGLLPITSFDILVNSINDPPVLTTPGAQVVNEDETLTLTGTTRIQVSDPDSDPITVTLTAGQGTINLTSGGAGVTGNNTDTVEVSGTQAALDIALSTLIYRPAANYSGPDVIRISADDGGGGSPAVGTININVRPINDAPTLSLSAGSLSVNEDTPLTITIDTTDIDAGSGIVGATLTAPNGRINLGSLVGVGFENGTADGGSTLSLAGTISAIAGALASVTYQGAKDFNGADTLTVTVNDRGGTGATGPLSVTRSLNLTVNPINDAPRFTLTTTGVTVNEDSGAQTVTGFAGGISAGAPDEEASQSLTFNIVNNSNTGLFSVQPTISNTGVLTYTPTANAFGSAIIVVSLSDSGSNTAPNVNTSALSTFTINVLGVNDAPSFSLLGSSLTVNEDAPPTTVAWATGITAGPGETPPQNVNFLLTNNNAALFAVAPTMAPNGSLSYTLAANANGRAVITVQLKDDGGVDRGGVDTSAIQSFTLNVTAVNDAPVLTVPGARVIDEDSQLTVTGVSLTDVDAGTAPMRVTVAAPRGTLGFATTTGVTLTGNNSATVQLVGSQTDLNTALGSFTYLGRRDVFGADRITITADDQNNTGTGGRKTDVKTIDVTVNPVNDAPILNIASLTRTVREDISTTIGAGIRITDVDSPSVQVTLSALQGTISLTPNAGITVTDNGTGTVTASGTVAGLNTALGTLRYQGNLNFNGSDEIAVQVDDTVGGGGLTDAKTLSVTVTPVNDLPTLTVPTSLSVNEDEVLSFVPGTLLLTDVDSGSNPISLGLSVTSGTLSLATEGLTGTGNGTRTLSFTGTVDALQAALDTLTYQGNLNFNGNDRLNIAVNDRGFTGATSSTSVTRSVSLVVGSVNDLPVLSRNNTLTVNEGNPGVTSTPITSALLFTTDSDATDTPARLTYSIVSAPTNGNLFLGGTTLTGGTFTQADINSGRLAYRHNGTETLGDSFVFTVTDQTAVLDPSTFNILVLAGNDRPVLTTRLPLTVSEGRVGTIGASLLQSTDPDNTAAQVRYTLSSKPGNGDLRLNGTNLSIGQSFSQADVTGNAVTYRHNGSETTLDSFVFTVNDGSGGSIGSTTFNITITPTNDLPVLVSRGPVTVAEGGVSTLNASLLLTTDADNLATELRYTLLGTTTFGTLKLGGTTLNAGGQFTQAQVNQITYEHNGTESTEDFFSFQVSDGITTTPITSLFRFNITPVNDSPDFVANTGLSIAADSLGSVTSITADQLGVTDVDNTPDTLVYTLVSVPDPAVGSLQLRRGGTPVTLAAGGTFTQADIDNGDLVYAYISGGTSDFFQFTVADGPGAPDLSSTFIISFT